MFLTFQIAVEFDRLYSKKPLCPHSDKDYPGWYWLTNYGCLGNKTFSLSISFVVVTSVFNIMFLFFSF